VRDATRAVAALPGKTAVLVEDAVGRHGILRMRCFNRQQLIESDAEVAVAHATDLFGIRKGCAGPAIDDGKIIAGTVHFGKTQGTHCAAPASVVSGSGLTNGPLLPQAASNRLLQSSTTRVLRACRFMGKV
jgi:hypothetical protein